MISPNSAMRAPSGIRASVQHRLDHPRRISAPTMAARETAAARRRWRCHPITAAATEGSISGLARLSEGARDHAQIKQTRQRRDQPPRQHIERHEHLPNCGPTPDSCAAFSLEPTAKEKPGRTPLYRISQRTKTAKGTKRKMPFGSPAVAPGAQPFQDRGYVSPCGDHVALVDLQTARGDQAGAQRHDQRMHPRDPRAEAVDHAHDHAHGHRDQHRGDRTERAASASPPPKAEAGGGRSRPTGRSLRSAWSAPGRRRAWPAGWRT